MLFLLIHVRVLLAKELSGELLNFFIFSARVVRRDLGSVPADAADQKEPDDT